MGQIVYVRKNGSDCWHFAGCSHLRKWAPGGWVHNSMFEFSRRRPNGDLCNEAKAKERAAQKERKGAK